MNFKYKSLLAIAIILFTSSAQAKESLSRNEKLVTTFYQQLFGDKDISAIDKYLSKDYIQHNPSAADGSEALKTLLKEWFKGAPKSIVDIQHIASKGDIVFLHVRYQAPDGKTQAIVDIFRVKNGKIVEHWDVIQEVPEKSANAHPMF